MEITRPIGIMDSGVGGLTLVPELQKLCPGEDIVYFGDSANCPYGNRTRGNILELSRQIIAFLRQKQVKAIAIACNTISALADILNAEEDIEILEIVNPIGRAVAASGLEQVGVIATKFTISTGAYERAIHTYNPAVKVYGRGSPNLSALVDQGAGDAALEEEIGTELGALLRAHPVSHVILGCTHYPIALDSFHKCFPGIEYINPAQEQAKSLVGYLEKSGLLNPQEKGRFSVYTSGGTGVYRSVIQKLGLPAPDALETIWG